jgi:hypothetical protein
VTPRPRDNLVLYHGVLAPHARWRPRAVSYEGSTTPLVATGAVGSGARGDVELQKEAPGKPRYWAWADLMRRAFDRDVRACPRCGGRMRLLATIEDPRVIRRILAHLRLPPEGPDPSPSRAPPGATGDLFADLPTPARYPAQRLAAPRLGAPAPPLRGTSAPSRAAKCPSRSPAFCLDGVFIRAVAWPRVGPPVPAGPRMPFMLSSLCWP